MFGDMQIALKYYVVPKSCDNVINTMIPQIHTISESSKDIVQMNFFPKLYANIGVTSK